MGFGSCRTSGSTTVLIDLMGVGAGPESGLCVRVKCFFDYLIKAIKLLLAFFYFYYH